MCGHNKERNLESEHPHHPLLKPEEVNLNKSQTNTTYHEVNAQELSLLPSYILHPVYKSTETL